MTWSRAGKVLYVGISDTPAWVVSQANMLAELRGWSRFVGLQIRYSLLDRAAERDLLPMARSLDLAVTPWSVLGAGVLTGKYRARNDAGAPGDVRGRAARWEKRERDLRIADEVAAVAEEAGWYARQVAINWVRQQPGVIVPLIGARSLQQLNDNVAALEHSLSRRAARPARRCQQDRARLPARFPGLQRGPGPGLRRNLRQHRA